MEIPLQHIGQWLELKGPYLGSALRFEQDSRLIQRGDLFFAMKGERVDGHSYLEAVAAQGAIGAVVSVTYQGPDFGLQLFPVEDVLQALQLLARQVHTMRSCKVIAVTGSVGKTTTKEFISTLLQGSFRVMKTPGNANSQVGMPLSLLNATGNEEVCVLEMGMTEEQGLSKLVAIAPPDIAVITHIGLSHAVFFSDGIEGIARAKSEILSHALTRYGILSAQASQYSACHQGSSEKICYGLQGSGASFGLGHSEQGMFIETPEGRSPYFTLPFQASHLIENATAALCVARLLGIDWDTLIPRVSLLRPFSKRFERVEKEGVIFINDSYNASPASMKAALNNLPTPTPGGKTIAVLGAMRELGPYTEESHHEVALAAVDKVDHLLCLGPECAPMPPVFAKRNKPAEWFLELPSLKERLRSLAKQGDVILLKGSNSNKLWELVD